MSSVCISSCVDDARVPVRATYRNLYKWPESDAEFVKSVSSGSRGQQRRAGPGVVDSISCRQMYLRSYSFSRKESVRERTKKCLGRVKERVARPPRRNSKKRSSPLTAFFSIFHRLLSCTAKVDVVDDKNMGFGT